MVSPLTLKVFLITLMFLITVIFGLLPLRLLKLLRKRAHLISGSSTWPSLTLTLLSCFSGGVFLGACFLDLLPEVIEHVADLKAKLGVDSDYPYPELLSCAGFFLVYLVEELTLLLLPGLGHHHVHTHPSPLEEEPSREPTGAVAVVVNAVRQSSPLDSASRNNTNNNLGERQEEGNINNYVPFDDVCARRHHLLSDETNQSTTAVRNGSPLLDKRLHANGAEQQEQQSSSDHHHFDKHERPVCVGRRLGEKFYLCHSGDFSSSNSEDYVRGRTSFNRKKRVYGSCEHQPRCRSLPDLCVLADLHDEVHPSTRQRGKLIAEPERCEIEDSCEGRDEEPPILMASQPHAHSHGVRSVTFVLALSFHSVLEGAAFGVQGSNQDVALLFLSLIVHKCVVAFSVGLQLGRTHAHQLKWVVASVLVLAFMSPLGAVIGLGLEEVTSANSDTKDIVVIVFEGLAVGTFLYVTFFEILINERNNEHPNLLKLMSLFVGFAIIGLLQTIGSHSHSTE